MKACPRLFRSFRAFVFLWAFPGALPQAITFRAAGASCRLEFELIVVRFVAKKRRYKLKQLVASNYTTRYLESPKKFACYLLACFGWLFFPRFRLFRQLCFLLRSQVADDNFAFRNDLNLKIN